MKALGFGFGFNSVSTSMRKGLHQNGISQGSPTLDLGHISNIKKNGYSASLSVVSRLCCTLYRDKLNTFRVPFLVIFIQLT